MIVSTQTTIDEFDELRRTKDALWEIIDAMRLTDQHNMGIKDILEKHNVPIPFGKEVW